jgi:hypothetical protein
MSYATLAMAIKDQELIDRVVAAACKEAWAGGPQFRDSEFGRRLRTYPQEAVGAFMWAVSIDNEADYEYAVGTEGGPNPGSSQVVSDASLQAAVQAHWPTAAYVPNPLPMASPWPGVPV